MARKETQRWDLSVHGQTHRVEVQGSVFRTIRWHVDDDLVATKRTTKDNVSLEAETDIGHALELQFDVLGHTKRATLYERGDTMLERVGGAMGHGGIDLDPEPGSPAARREQRIREHPWRHTTIATVGGVAKVVVPVLLGLLVVRFAINLPWPHWNIPWPDIELPRISWPDIPWPEIPWPDVDAPNWQVPEWVRWVAKTMGYGWPVLLALVLAKLEVDRRREQDALKAELKGATDPATHSD